MSKYYNNIAHQTKPKTNFKTNEMAMSQDLVPRTISTSSKETREELYLSPKASKKSDKPLYKVNSTKWCFKYYNCTSYQNTPKTKAKTIKMAMSQDVVPRTISTSSKETREEQYPSLEASKKSNKPLYKVNNTKCCFKYYNGIF